MPTKTLRDGTGNVTKAIIDTRQHGDKHAQNDGKDRATGIALHEHDDAHDRDSQPDEQADIACEDASHKVELDRAGIALRIASGGTQKECRHHQ